MQWWKYIIACNPSDRVFHSIWFFKIAYDCLIEPSPPTDWFSNRSIIPSNNRAWEANILTTGTLVDISMQHNHGLKSTAIRDRIVCIVLKKRLQIVSVQCTLLVLIKHMIKCIDIHVSYSQHNLMMEQHSSKLR